MRPIPRRALLVVAAAAALQTAGYLVYRRIQAERGRTGVVPFAYEEIDPPAPLPNLAFEDIEGQVVPLESQTRRPLLLHFWATWCAPCRSELPSLLAYADAQDPGKPALLLVSLDENWQVVRHYFDDAVPPQVVRDASRVAARELGVGTLPETRLLLPPGATVARLRGARDWQTDDARDAVSRLLRSR